MSSTVEFKPVELERIDYDYLRDVDDIPEAVEFSIIASHEPSDTWITEFDTAYHAMHNPIKPPVSIIGNRLWISYLPRYSADLPNYINFILRVVNVANDEEKRSLTIHEHDPTGAKDRFRNVLKGVRL